MGLTPVTRYLQQHRIGVALVVILLVALGLRLYGINWDQGYGFHPDERSIYMQSDCMFRILTHGQGYQDCPLLKDFPNIEPGLPSLGVFFDADRSPLNPHWFPLGSVMIYLLVFIRSILEPFTDLSTFDMRYVGRTLSALADVGSIFLIFLIGRRLFDQRVGLFAAFLMALAVVHIQSSHFYRPETFIVLLVLASYWFMLNVMDHRRLRDWLFLGLFVGLTFATKVSVLPLLLPLLLVYGFRLFSFRDVSLSMPSADEVYRVMRHAVVGAAVAVTVFLVLTPYAIIDLPEFLSDTTWEAGIARQAGKMPYTVQYIGSTPFLYELRQSTLWALGFPLGIAVWGGLLYAIFRSVTRKPGWKGDLLLLAWVVPNFVLVAWFFEVKFLRYIFPIMPFLILFGARGMVALLDGARSLSNAVRATAAELRPLQRLQRRALPLAMGLVAIVVAASVLYALGFMGIYSRPHTAVAASDWINENVTPGTTIITDNHWDEGIPEVYRYDVRQIPIYEGETNEKMEGIARDLSQAEYLIFYSNRTYGSIARVPERYPLSSNYYRRLFSGDLGYQFDRAFTSYPGLLGLAWKNDTFDRATLPEPQELKDSKPATLTLNLGYADENVTNYDHPAVLLFKNVGGLSQEEMLKTLTFSELPETASDLGLMLSQEELKAQREGGTWSSIIKIDSWTNKVPILAWLLMVELIYLVTLPLAFFVFRPLPDRGIVLAKLLGILGVSYVAWMLASLHWLSFSRASMLVGLLVLAGLSSLVLLKNWREMAAFLRRHWRLLVIAEALFLAAFLSFVALRMANPDLWHPWLGGEKPMDLAYLNAILRSTYMPPFDPWFAGGFINYYYWGLFIVANLIKATGILPSVAYNLAIPLFFALTVTASYSIVYNVTEGLRKTRKAAPEESQAPVRKGKTTLGWIKGPVVAGLLAALFVTVMGNLDGAIQLVQSGWNSVVRAESFGSFDFWRSSRMLPELPDLNPSALTFWLDDRTVLSTSAFCASGLRPDNTCPDISPHITEFPFFSFLFADLHAHVIIIPFTLLVLGLALSFLVGLKTATRGWVIGVVPIFALALGSLWVINTWDYPAYLLLMLAVLAVGAHLMVGRANHKQRVWTFIGVSVSTTVLSLLAFLPFHLRYDTFGQLLDRAKWQTPLENYLAIHGLFIFLILTFLIYLNRRPLKAALMSLLPSTAVKRETTASQPRSAVKITWATIVTPVVMVLIIYLAAAGYWTAAALTALIGLAAMAVREEFAKLDEGSGYLLFPVIIAGFAFLIGVGVEFVSVGDDIGRMNTLFKFYLEAWILMALAAAIGLWYLGQRGVFSLGRLAPSRYLSLSTLAILSVLIVIGFAFWVAVRVDSSRLGDQFSRLDSINSYSIAALVLLAVALVALVAIINTRGVFYLQRFLLPKALWITLLAILAFSSFIYVGLGSRERLANRFDTQEMTLNGESFMARAVHWEKDVSFELKWDQEAIIWLRSNVQGSPVVLEAHTEQYRWGARFANYTGLPTVIGWPWHQIQQRGDYSFAVRQRAADVREAYSTLDHNRALELLSTYDVRYIVVGDLERIWYPQPGLDKFQAMVDQGLLRMAYRNEGTAIYEVVSTSTPTLSAGTQK